MMFGLSLLQFVLWEFMFFFYVISILRILVFKTIPISYDARVVLQ